MVKVVMATSAQPLDIERHGVIGMVGSQLTVLAASLALLRSPQLPIPNEKVNQCERGRA
jgi:hypothetical protein